ncbi:F-box/kelch-repeat protein skip25, partial [Phtheirospermum japonicum]
AASSTPPLSRHFSLSTPSYYRRIIIIIIIIAPYSSHPSIPFPVNGSQSLTRRPALRSASSSATLRSSPTVSPSNPSPSPAVWSSSPPPPTISSPPCPSPSSSTRSPVSGPAAHRSPPRGGGALAGAYDGAVYVAERGRVAIPQRRRADAREVGPRTETAEGAASVAVGGDGEARDAKFSREAIDAVGWRGKLCMVNVKGAAAKEGIVYDVGRDAWEAMPAGMLAGWRGPAAAMEEETLYVVDERRGWLNRYDHVRDTWAEVV